MVKNLSESIWTGGIVSHKKEEETQKSGELTTYRPREYITQEEEDSVIT